MDARHGNPALGDVRAPPSPPAFSVEAGRGDSREPRPPRKPESRSRCGRSGSSPAARAARISGRWASPRAPSGCGGFVQGLRMCV